MLLAYENGAELIVSVGAQFNPVEFLDKNRAGMSSTFLTRLRIGDRLVDAKGVSRLYNPGLRFAARSGVFLGVAVLLPADRRAGVGPAERACRPNLAEDRDSAGPLMGYSSRYHVASLAAAFIALAVGISSASLGRRHLRAADRLERNSSRTRPVRAENADLREELVEAPVTELARAVMVDRLQAQDRAHGLGDIDTTTLRDDARVRSNRRARRSR